MTDTSAADPQPESPAPRPSGYSTVAKAAALSAGFEHPLLSSLVAGELLQHETDPMRRRQLERFRSASRTWWVVGLVAGVVMLLIVLVIASSTYSASDSCSGGIDRMDPMNTTYESTDGTHWTATFPCQNGGETTVPVPRAQVPGAGR
jgi:hypothetical protein